MRKAGFYFCGAILSVSALVLGVGCGPSESGNTGGSGGGTNTTTSTTTSGETTASSSPTTTTTTTGGGSAATCDTYCAALNKNCAGENAQYTTEAACKSACADITVIGQPNDKMGASLECHAYHANAAAMDAKLHCPHAGPTGGDKIVSDTMEGACGDGCNNFCDMAMKACGGEKTYADLAACNADCRKFKTTTQEAYSSTYYSQMANWKDDFGCRMYHLTVAAGSADLAKTHCPHIMSTSMACTK